MKFAHILSRLTSTPWCITTPAFQAILDLLTARVNGIGAIQGLPRGDAATPARMESGQGVAVIPIHGIIGKHLSQMEMECGGCDLDAVEEAIDAALISPRIQKAILHFDTPGGTVAGVPELFAHIVAARSESAKEVFAFSDSQCCSAGYYLASACDAIFCTPTAQMGNVGVKMVLRDTSEADAKAGIKFRVFKSGEFKDMGASYRAPTDAEAKMMQAEADMLGAQFRADILSQRPSVVVAALEGQAFFGKEAAQNGIVDEVVSSFNELLESLSV